MAVTESVLRSGVNVKLNAGSNPSGGMITRSVSLGKLTSDADAQKVANVVGPLAMCLALNPVRIERATVTVIEP